MLSCLQNLECICISGRDKVPLISVIYESKKQPGLCCRSYRCQSVFSLSTAPHCQNTGAPARPHRHPLRSETLLCVALTLNPVSIYQCLLLVAQAGISTEAMGADDYTLACPCPLGTSSLLTSATVNYTQETHSDQWPDT